MCEIMWYTHWMNYCKVINGKNASMDTCGRLSWISFRVFEYLLYFKLFIFLLFMFIYETNNDSIGVF